MIKEQPVMSQLEHAWPPAKATSPEETHLSSWGLFSRLNPSFGGLLRGQPGLPQSEQRETEICSCLDSANFICMLPLLSPERL